MHAKWQIAAIVEGLIIVLLVSYLFIPRKSFKQIQGFIMMNNRTGETCWGGPVPVITAEEARQKVQEQRENEWGLFLKNRHPNTNLSDYKPTEGETKEWLASHKQTVEDEIVIMDFDWTLTYRGEGMPFCKNLN